MRILVATGIYPPAVGGPSYYAKGLVEALALLGHEAKPVTFGPLLRYPTGIRHLLFFLQLLKYMFWADRVIALDTVSVAVPVAVATSIFRTPFVVRTGGDFVWEQYLERTGELFPLKDFYTKTRTFSRKEKLLLRATSYVVRRASLIIFSTQMQKDIWVAAYHIDTTKARIIGNAVETELPSVEPTKKNFLWYVRNTAFKNSARLHEAFNEAKQRYPEIILEEGQVPQKELFLSMQSCYAVILPSLTDISPNYIVDALRFRKPFIMDMYSGMAEQFKPYGTLVDPESVEDIVRAIENLASEEGYRKALEKVRTFSQVRTYKEIAKEFVTLLETV